MKTLISILILVGVIWLGYHMYHKQPVNYSKSESEELLGDVGLMNRLRTHAVVRVPNSAESLSLTGRTPNVSDATVFVTFMELR